MAANDAKLIPIAEVAERLFGDASDTSRKRVRNMIASDVLRGRKIGIAQRSPFWILRSSFEEFLATL